MKTIIFSPTGGTKKVADILASVFEKDYDVIDLMPKKMDDEKLDIPSDQLCIIAVPSFGGRVPATAVKRIRNIKGNGARAIIVAVIGNRAFDDTLIELKDVAESCGFNVIAAISANAEHSIVREIGSGRPDPVDKAELEGFADLIKHNLEYGLAMKADVPGNHAYKEYNGVPAKPIVTAACKECGLCSFKCPVGAIKFDNPKETDYNLCISCMRCIASCPKKARKVDDNIMAAVGQMLKDVCPVRQKNEIFC